MLARRTAAIPAAVIAEPSRVNLTVGRSWRAILTMAPSGSSQQSISRRVAGLLRQISGAASRVKKSCELPASYPQPHRANPAADISSMNGKRPAKD